VGLAGAGAAALAGEPAPAGAGAGAAPRAGRRRSSLADTQARALMMAA